MRQMMVRALLIPTGVVIGRTLLEARAGQVPHVHGYMLDLVIPPFSDFTSAADALETYGLLLAAPRVETAVAGFNDPLFHAVRKSKSTLALIAETYFNVGTTGGTHAFRTSTGWLPAGFDVPGLWVAGGNRPNATTVTSMVTYHVLFDWVSKSAEQVAALYTSYGIDSVDAEERQATPLQDVNFNRGVSEGALPPLVG